MSAPLLTQISGHTVDMRAQCKDCGSSMWLIVGRPAYCFPCGLSHQGELAAWFDSGRPPPPTGQMDRWRAAFLAANPDYVPWSERRTSS